MTNNICLNKDYSTTQQLVKNKPILKNTSDDKYETFLSLALNSTRSAEGGLRNHGYFKQSHQIEKKPLVSIITIVYNGESHLEETILSVLNQSYDNIEYIIIDGGSTDGTLDIINKYENAIDYWVSEKDAGISDAFNKGISLCTGDIIGIINADDYYELTAIETVANVWTKDIDVIHGQMRYWFTQTKYIDIEGNHSSIETEMNIHHPASFVSKDCYKKSGLFFKEYKYAMDYELMLRFFKDERKFLYVNILMSSMRAGGESNKHLIKSISEMRKAQLLYLDNYFSIYFNSYLLLGRRLLSSGIKYLGLHFLIALYRKVRN